MSWRRFFDSLQQNTAVRGVGWRNNCAAGVNDERRGDSSGGGGRGGVSRSVLRLVCRPRPPPMPQLSSAQVMRIGHDHNHNSILSRKAALLASFHFVLCVLLLFATSLKLKQQQGGMSCKRKACDHVSTRTRTRRPGITDHTHLYR